MYGSPYNCCQTLVKLYSQGGFFVVVKVSAYEYASWSFALVNLGELRSGRCWRNPAEAFSKVVGEPIAVNYQRRFHEEQISSTILLGQSISLSRAGISRRSSTSAIDILRNVCQIISYPCPGENSVPPGIPTVSRRISDTPERHFPSPSTVQTHSSERNATLWQARYLLLFLDGK